ncbi:MAG: phasin family protein [Alphaproteobacteria bacterium]
MAESKKRSSGKSASRRSKGARKPAGSPDNILEGFFPQQSNQAMEKIMSQSKSKMDKMAQDASNFGREGFEAFMQSSTIFTKGFEEIARTAIALGQSAAEKQAQFINQAMSSKTLNEWAETQNKIAQASLDDLMSAATKLSEMSVKLMTESAQPINEQMGKSIRKASEAVAA